MNNDTLSWAQRLEKGEFGEWERRARQKQRAWIWAITISKCLKRLMDIVGGAVGLMLFSPIFIFTAICIKLEDGGPIFFKQRRIGALGRPFDIWKFRSMVVNADQIKDQILESNQHGKDGVTFKMKDDPRITKTGNGSVSSPSTNSTILQHAHWRDVDRRPKTTGAQRSRYV